MVWLLQEVTDRLSVEATWMPRWDEHFPDTHVRLEPRGTFFSTDDFAVDDGKIFYSGFGRRNDSHGAAGVFPMSRDGQLYLPRGSTREDKGFQYGVALRYLFPSHPNAEISLYHVDYHSRTPYVSGVRGRTHGASDDFGQSAPAEVAALEAAGIPATAAGNPACTAVDLPAFDRLQTPANIARLAPIVGGVAPATLLSAQNATNAACATAAGRAGTAFVDYPKHIKLWGIGASAGFAGGVSLQGEYSYRGNQPLQLPTGGGAPRRGRRRQPADRHRPRRRQPGALRHRDHRLSQGRNAPGAGDRDQGVRPDPEREPGGGDRGGRLYAPRPSGKPQVCRTRMSSAAAGFGCFERL